MYITSEYTTLVKDDEVIKILPNIKFDNVPNGYKVTAFARILDLSTNEVIELLPGTITALHPPSLDNLKPKTKRGKK